MPAAILAILSGIAQLGVSVGKSMLEFAKREALRAARAARALAVWVLAFVASRTALQVAVVVASDALLAYVTASVVTPLAGDLLHRLIPSGSAGDGLIWILWDTGLCGRILFSSFVVYIVNYTALWHVFNVWLRSMSVALSAYKAAQKRADKIMEASIR